MRRRLSLVTASVVLLATLRTGAAGELRLHVDLKERVNAVYHMACLAESIACTRDVFERFWKERLGWTNTDQSALDLWRHVMREVTSTAPARPPAPLLPNAPRFHPEQAAREAVMVATVESESPRDLRLRSSDALSTENAERVITAIDHFERRIAPWFRSTGRRAIEKRVRQVEQIARHSRFTETTTQVAAFLEATLAHPDVYMHAIAGPEPQSKDYAATQFGSHFVGEVVDATTGEGIVSGAVHELTHYMYDRAPAAKHLALLEEFVRSGAPSYAGLYTYLNEAIASAAQGFHADKLGEKAKEGEAYDHPYVAPLGAATVPLLKDAVAHGATLFDGFAARYIAAGTAALKDKLFQPQFVLAQVALLLPDDSDRITAAYFSSMFPKASARFREERELDAFPDLNVVRFIRYDALGALGDSMPQLASLTVHRGFAYVVRRGPRARTYLLAGRDTDAVIDVITKLGTVEALKSDGLLFSLD